MKLAVREQPADLSLGNTKNAKIRFDYRQQKRWNQTHYRIILLPDADENRLL
jgi:hypothetical protein